MKKNIVIVVLVIVSLFFVFYAFIKADEAAKAGIEAQMQREQAELLQKEADVLKEEALMVATEAKRQEAIAIAMKNELEACKGN